MAESPQARLERLMEELREEFPGFVMIDKSKSQFQKLIHKGLVVITLGQMRDYIQGYHSTVGQRVYVTPDWEDKSAESRYLTLCHERVHMRQFRRYTFLGMSFLYLLVPLPMGLAYFRARFELEAYGESIRAACELYGPDHVRDPSYRRYILDQFTGPSYGWMWPFEGYLNRWYDAQLERVGAA